MMGTDVVMGMRTALEWMGVTRVSSKDRDATGTYKNSTMAILPRAAARMTPPPIDRLLSMIDHLNRYRQRIVGEKRRERKIRERGERRF
jgi:hypothetical protein